MMMGALEARLKHTGRAAHRYTCEGGCCSGPAIFASGATCHPGNFGSAARGGCWAVDGGSVVPVEQFGFCEEGHGRVCEYVVVLRDPIERLVSAYNYFCLGCFEGRQCAGGNEASVEPYDCPGGSLVEYARRVGPYYALSLVAGADRDRARYQLNGSGWPVKGPGGATLRRPDAPARLLVASLRRLRAESTHVLLLQDFGAAAAYRAERELGALLGDASPWDPTWTRSENAVRDVVRRCLGRDGRPPQCDRGAWRGPIVNASSLRQPKQLPAWEAAVLRTILADDYVLYDEALRQRARRRLHNVQWRKGASKPSRWGERQHEAGASREVQGEPT